MWEIYKIWIPCLKYTTNLDHHVKSSTFNAIICQFKTVWNSSKLNFKTIHFYIARLPILCYDNNNCYNTESAKLILIIFGYFLGNLERSLPGIYRCSPIQDNRADSLHSYQVTSGCSIAPSQLSPWRLSTQAT